MGRVALDFGVGRGAKRSADIRSDLGQASNEGQRQNQRNPGGREAEGQLAASLVRYSPLRGCASLAPCHPPFCLYARPIPVFQLSPSAFVRRRARRRRALCAKEVHSRSRSRRCFVISFMTFPIHLLSLHRRMCCNDTPYHTVRLLR